MTTLDTLLNDLKTERLAQISREGWTPEHDDTHVQGDFAMAAAAYAVAGRSEDDSDGTAPALTRVLWPWTAAELKPHDYRCNLLRAGALVLAELERVERMADTVKFFAVGESSEIYFARDLDALRDLLAERGCLPEHPAEIWEVPGNRMGAFDEAGEKPGTLRQVFIDTYAHMPPPPAEQLQSHYN
ncbi:hypothetical protein [Deinococcus sp. Leaf326]|uniref:hypothetical protein n=1 Tax=Deinococcus sp. Leaf326 TaxID=1736338 RepID=UPI0006F6F56C|nr:hypothetical protein [Deinococcus sp. Leaf326]KQR40784.1 hypothetical protein ASF71_01040 [Deinococcus sp. Leaf326]